ncbi:ATP-binding protein [Evansella sp. AB-rgal1]|uniref:ATP-binding protein n=1 Tax=Evansella sp. AB-rgal1 TaxID=3242696 RepID=UPI00359E95F0
MEPFLHYLLNIFIILTPIFLYTTLWSGKKVTTHKNLTKIVFFFVCATVMFLTQIFPITLYGEIMFDLRYISIALGTLYGGFYTGLGLTILSIILKYTSIDLHITIFSFVVSIYFVLSSKLISNYINEWNTTRKYGSICIMFTLPSLFVLAYPTNLLIIPRLDSFLVMLGFLIFNIPVALLVYMMIERIRMGERLNKELEKSEQLRLVSELAASVAHEVRNPMTVARGFIQLIHSHSNLTEREKQYLLLTISELDRAQSIISDYLSLSKPEKIILKKVNIYHIIEKVRHTIQAYALMNNVFVEMNAPSHLSVFGNEKELTQVILNLAKNGIEAMENGGTLLLSAYGRNDVVEVVIKDTGQGMTKEQISRIGTAYFSTKEQGTGLGLKISYNIIKNLGGSITVKSEWKNGTEFIITLPSKESTIEEEDRKKKSELNSRTDFMIK